MLQEALFAAAQFVEFRVGNRQLGVLLGDAIPKVFNVSATRIAAILAGRVNGLLVGYSNDVISISGISAKVLGADLDHDGVADDIAGTAWLSGDLNGLVDGIVIVKSGGYSGTLPTSAFAAFLFQV